MKVKNISNDIVVQLTLALLLSFYLFNGQSFTEASDGKIYLVEDANKEITLTGYTRSIATMMISSEVSGKVISVNYDVGDFIAEKPVVEVDPTFIDFQIQGLRQSLRLLENNLKKADERVKFLYKEFIRIDTLHKEDRATEVKRDAMEQEVIQAKLAYGSVSIEKHKLEISLNELLERKKRHRVFAPAEWNIVGKMVETGEQIVQGTPLARLSDFRTLVVPLSVSGEELEAIHKLNSEFSAYLEKELVKAAIRWINPEFDEKTRKLGIEFLITQYTGEKRGGLRFILPIKIPVQGIQIPKACVIDRYENPRVTLKATGEFINVMVLDETDGYLLIAEDPRLLPGTELLGRDTR